MIESLKALVLRILRVPAEPTPPAGSPESVRIFRASRKLYYLTLIRWAFAHLAALAGLVIVLIIDFSANLGHVSVPLRIIEIIALISFFIQMPCSFLFVRFDYELRWYIVTDRSLRIRYGMLAVREMTMAFANIQQITIHQGPLQRLLGIADLEVRTAGGGAGQAVDSHGCSQGASSGHLGFFRGVENAADIRDLILARLRQWRDSGLGDPDEIRTTEAAEAKTLPSTGDAVSVAQLVLVEVRALRAAICPEE